MAEQRRKISEIPPVGEEAAQEGERLYKQAQKLPPAGEDEESVTPDTVRTMAWKVAYAIGTESTTAPDGRRRIQDWWQGLSPDERNTARQSLLDEAQRIRQIAEVISQELQQAYSQV